MCQTDRRLSETPSLICPCRNLVNSEANLVKHVADGEDVLVMELAGSSLVFWIAERESDILKVLVDIATAVEYLHSQNMVHRDIKVHNVTVCTSPHYPVLAIPLTVIVKIERNPIRATLIDLATVRFLPQGNVGMTTISTGHGKQAPEKVRGLPADVFAFGTILEWFVTKRHALGNDTVAALKKLYERYGTVRGPHIKSFTQPPLLVEFVRCYIRKPSSVM